MADNRGAKRPKTVAIITDNTAASISSVKRMKDDLLAPAGLELVVDEVFTPPLADATPLVQKLRATRPDLLFFLRSEERRVGKECVSSCRSRWSTYAQKKKEKKKPKS